MAFCFSIWDQRDRGETEGAPKTWPYFVLEYVGAAEAIQRTRFVVFILWNPTKRNLKSSGKSVMLISDIRLLGKID